MASLCHKRFLFSGHSVPKHVLNYLKRQALNYSLKSKKPHTPVMLEEVIESLNLKEGDMFLDMTFGAGGHSEALLQRIPKLQVFALDRDPTAIQFADKLQMKYPGQLKFLEGKFSDLPSLLSEYGIIYNTFDGILFDLGCSSMQLEEPLRGFSVTKDGPLDMRMGSHSENDLTAADVVNFANEKDLIQIFKVYGGEKSAFKVANAILQARSRFGFIKTTGQLCDIIDTALESQMRTDKLNRKTSLATKCFQALRIFVNNELNEINFGIMVAHKYLRPGGRAVVLTFHSGEDIIVKRQFQNRLVDNALKPLPLIYFNSEKDYEEDLMEDFIEKKWIPIHKKVIEPTEEEVVQNPRSRSAKLRVAEKIDEAVSCEELAKKC